MESKRPLCPYCNTEWGDEQVNTYVESLGSCSCGNWTRGVFEITCSNCKKVIYRKESESDLD